MNKLFITFALLALVAVVFSAKSKSRAITTCSANSANCDIYTCLQNQYKCSNNNYLTQFGKPYCDKYNNEKTYTNDVFIKNFITDAKKCMQSALISQLQSTSTCADIDAIALKSHRTCFQPLCKYILTNTAQLVTIGNSVKTKGNKYERDVRAKTLAILRDDCKVQDWLIPASLKVA